MYLRSPAVSTEWLKEQLEAQKTDENAAKHVLLDVRTEDEYKTNHVPNSLHLNRQKLADDEGKPGVEAFKRTIKICHSRLKNNLKNKKKTYNKASK